MRRLLSQYAMTLAILGVAVPVGMVLSSTFSPRIIAPEQARAERLVEAHSRWVELDIKKEQINKLAVAQRSVLDARQVQIKATIVADIGCAVSESDVPQQVREFLYTPTPQPTWNPQDYDPNRMRR